MHSLRASYKRPGTRRAVPALAGVTLVMTLLLSGCGSSTSSSAVSSEPAAAASEAAPASEAAVPAADVTGKVVKLVHCGDVNPWCAVYNKTIMCVLKGEWRRCRRSSARTVLCQ